MAGLKSYRNAHGVVALLDAENGALALGAGWVAVDDSGTFDDSFSSAADISIEVDEQPIPAEESPVGDSDNDSESETVGSEDFTNSDAGLDETPPVKRARARKAATN